MHVFKAQDSYHFASMSLQLFLEYTVICILCENKQKNSGRWCHGVSDRSDVCSNESFKRDLCEQGRVAQR